MNFELQQIDAAIAEVHNMANLGQGLDTPRLRALEERRDKLTTTFTSAVAENSSETVQKAPEPKKHPVHRGVTSYGVQTPVTVDAAVYIRLDKPRNGKWINLMIRTRNPKRTYYPAYSVANDGFTNTDDFRRWEKRFPEQVEAVLALVRNQLKAREGQENDNG